MKKPAEERKLREAERFFIEVDTRGFYLWLYKRPDELSREFVLHKEYGVSIGADGFNTPIGPHIINTKVKDPDWRRPDSEWVQPPELRGTIVPGGDPANPLKARWLGVTDPSEGVGIHGTAERWSIGTAASHGCIRMLVEDVIELYDIVPVGTVLFVD